MNYVLWSLLITHLTIVFVSLYLHRSLAHKSLTLHPAFEHFVRFWLWCTTGINTTTWVAIHRKHHRYADEPHDPHSPQQQGIMRILLGGTFVYLREGRDAIAMQAYGRGCPRDWIEKNVYQRLPYLGLFLSFALYVSVWGSSGTLMWLVGFLWIPFWAAGVVNGLGHWVGYRNFETLDYSRNFSPIGLIMAGEELHNNHHRDPASARLSKRWFELDIGWVWIRLFSMLGLLRVHNS